MRKISDVNISEDTDRILHSDIFEKAKHQPHHRDTTVAAHSADVARSAMKVCDLLEKHGIHTDKDKVVLASLCHDLGMVGRDEKYDSQYETCMEHPEESVEAVKEVLGEIDEETADMIRSHMWPMSKDMPDSKEALIVTLCDKTESVKDTLAWLGRRSLDTCIAVRDIFNGNRIR